MKGTTRIVSSLVLATSFVAASAPAQTLRYRSSEGESLTYVRKQIDHVVQTVSGQEQTTDIESFWRFTTIVESTASQGVTVAVVHDSVSIESTPQIPGGADFSGLYGKKVVIEMSDRGEVRRVVVPESLPPGAGRLDLSSAYRSFYPVLPEETVGDGDSWRDTTSVETTQKGLDLSVIRTNRYTAGPMTTVGDREARRVDFEIELDLEGSGRQQGAEISLSGSGTGSGTFYLQVEPGVYLGGEESTEMKMDAFVTSGGQSALIPIVQTRTETIELVE